MTGTVASVLRVSTQISCLVCLSMSNSSIACHRERRADHGVPAGAGRIGYFESKQIKGDDAQENFELAIQRIVASGPAAVYYAVDRGEYLDKLKSVYEKKRDK